MPTRSTETSYVMSEMPAVNGTGTARSIAKLYGSAATGDSNWA